MTELNVRFSRRAAALLFGNPNDFQAHMLKMARLVGTWRKEHAEP